MTCVSGKSAWLEPRDAPRLTLWLPGHRQQGSKQGSWWLLGGQEIFPSEGSSTGFSNIIVIDFLVQGAVMCSVRSTDHMQHQCVTASCSVKVTLIFLVNNYERNTSQFLGVYICTTWNVDVLVYNCVLEWCQSDVLPRLTLEWTTVSWGEEGGGCIRGWEACTGGNGTTDSIYWSIYT